MPVRARGRMVRTAPLMRPCAEMARMSQRGAMESRMVLATLRGSRSACRRIGSGAPPRPRTGALPAGANGARDFRERRPGFAHFLSERLGTLAGHQVHAGAEGPPRAQRA